MKILQKEKLEKYFQQKCATEAAMLHFHLQKNPPKNINRTLEDVLSINTKSVNAYLLMGR